MHGQASASSHTAQPATTLSFSTFAKSDSARSPFHPILPLHLHSARRPQPIQATQSRQAWLRCYRSAPSSCCRSIRAFQASLPSPHDPESHTSVMYLVRMQETRDERKDGRSPEEEGMGHNVKGGNETGDTRRANLLTDTLPADPAPPASAPAAAPQAAAASAVPAPATTAAAESQPTS